MPVYPSSTTRLKGSAVQHRPDQILTLDTVNQDFTQTPTAMPSVISRDFRSEAQDAKRAREHKQKWSHGTRPLAGVCTSRCSLGLYDDEHEHDSDRVRPMKLWE